MSPSPYNHRSPKRQPRPLDTEQLRALALQYVGRYATTRAKLAAYLQRKIIARGWEGEAAADLPALVENFAALGYVDDRGFATSRGAALSRRGYGGRRVEADLRAAGIDAADRADASRTAHEQSRTAALALARRRRIGPFAVTPPDRIALEKAIALMIRAGHSFEIAREIANLRSEEPID